MRRFNTFKICEIILNIITVSSYSTFTSLLYLPHRVRGCPHSPQPSALKASACDSCELWAVPLAALPGSFVWRQLAKATADRAGQCLLGPWLSFNYAIECVLQVLAGMNTLGWTTADILVRNKSRQANVILNLSSFSCKALKLV